MAAEDESHRSAASRPPSYRPLHALSFDAGGLATYEKLIRRVWGGEGGGNVEAHRSAVAKLRCKLSDDA